MGYRVKETCRNLQIDILAVWEKILISEGRKGYLAKGLKGTVS